MPNPLIYASTTPDHSLHKGGVAVGVNSVEYNPSNGWINGAIPTDWDYVIYKTTSGANPNIFAPANEQEFYNFVLMQGGSASDVTSVGAALAWITTQSDLLALHSSLPNIVTDGLVLDLNAGQVGSYPTTGTTWYDLSGQGHNGTLTNGPTFNSGDGGSIVFDSTDERVAQTGLGLSFTSFSIEATIKPASNNGAYNCIISTTLGTNSDYQYGVNWDFGPNSTTSFNVMNLEISRNFGGFYDRDVMNSSFPFNTWTHLFLTVDSVNNLFKIYVNGVLDYSGVYNGTITYFDRISIGQRYYASAYQGGSTFDGNISSVKIYNRSLITDEVSQNYYQAPIVTDGLTFAVDAGNLVSYENSSTSMYSLTGSADGTLVNGTGWNSLNGGIWEFDNSDDKITIPNNAAFNHTSQLTIESWVKFNGNSNDFIFEKGNVNTQYSLFSHGTDIVFRTYHAVGGGDTLLLTKANAGITNGQWHHIVGSWDGSTKSIYVDGVNVANQSKSGALTTTSEGAAIGAFGGTSSGYYFGGDIAIVRIYSKGLSTEEIGQNFQAQSSRFI